MPIVDLHPDPAKRSFKFGVGMTAPASRKAWIEKCRRAEDLGFDVIGVADHLGMPAPFPSLMLAAEATSRPRLATSVLNASFYTPALLARDAAAFDQLTDGRFELGLGTGYRRVEFDTAGLPWPSPHQRVAHLERMVANLRQRFADPEHQPQPVQALGPPLLLGGRGDRVLALAAREADIVAFTGFAPGNEGDTGYLANSEGFAERISYTRAMLGERIATVELNVLVWRVIVTKDRWAQAKRLEPMRDLSAEEMLEIPTVLIGTTQQIVDQLHHHREHLGITYFTISEYNLDAMAPVVELAR